MALVELVMPKMGESITEATVLKWLKQPGEPVKQDESLLEIATDKVDSDVPSTAGGFLEKIFFGANDVVPIGAVIATIRTETTDETNLVDDHAPATSGRYTPSQAEDIKQEQPVQNFSRFETHNGQNNAVNRFYSPLVMNIASSEGVSLKELEQIPGTGNEGRVTKKDILQFLQNRKSAPAKNSAVTIRNNTPAADNEESQNHLPAVYNGNVEIIEMDRMRKLIADHMVRSVQTSPHVTSFSEADVTNLVLWRESVKKEFEKREGTKITFTPLFIEALVRCIKRFPLINSSLDGNNIIIKKDINIGMATALPGGNLIVPVIRNADQLNLVGLSRQVNALAENARKNKLKPEDTQNGTFTLTNVGTFGSLMGTPIIYQPQVAILAVGAIKKRPVVVESPMGDSIAIRHMMYLSMSYDHRIIDGSLGATFLTAVANELENFNASREY